MARYSISEHYKQRPQVQMAPLIDIVFLTLVFFMTMSIFNQLESEIDISVPKSQEATETVRSPGEVIINVTKDGQFIVNQQNLNFPQLQTMLQRVSSLFPDQPVIIRADENSYHKHIIKVLDACAASNIWNISFATNNEDK